MNNKIKKEIDDYFSGHINSFDLRKKFLKILKSKEELSEIMNDLDEIKNRLTVNKKVMTGTVFEITISGRIKKIDEVINISKSIKDNEIKSNKKYFFIKKP